MGGALHNPSGRLVLTSRPAPLADGMTSCCSVVLVSRRSTASWVGEADPRRPPHASSRPGRLHLQPHACLLDRLLAWVVVHTGAQDYVRQAGKQQPGGGSSSCRRKHLSECFRFGPEIAAVANALLRVMKGETRRLVGTSEPTRIPRVCRCRCNCTEWFGVSLLPRLLLRQAWAVRAVCCRPLPSYRSRGP